MKRIVMCVVLACGLVIAVGCDVAKRKAEETVRTSVKHRAGRARDRAEDAGKKIGDSAVDAATGGSDSDKDADAEKRKKLKGNDE